jgi:hypothetical protein
LGQGVKYAPVDRGNAMFSLNVQDNQDVMPGDGPVSTQFWGTALSKHIRRRHTSDFF